MISKTSAPSTTFGRLLRTSLVVLLVPGAICAAQQSTSSDATKVSGLQAVQPKPPQIVRPMEGRDSRRRGVPWIENTDDAASPSTAPADFALAPKEPPRPGKAGGDTLRVSGWWTIEVKNPDGSTALHREVENTFNINSMIVYLLAGKLVPGEASIHFGAGNGNTEDLGDPSNFTVSPCSGSSGCLMSEIPGGYYNTLPQCTQNPGSCSSNLTPSIATVTVTLDTHCSFVGCVPESSVVPALELNGQITSQTSSTIGYLETDWLACSEVYATNTSPVTGLNPASCLAKPLDTLDLTIMTYLYLANPIPVSAGQVVVIKVDVSFSPFPS